MKEYYFEYTDQRFTWILFGITIGILIGLVVIFTLTHFNSPIFATFLSFGIPVLVFF